MRLMEPGAAWRPGMMPSACEAFETDDLDQAQAAMLRNYYPLRIKPLQARRGFSLNMSVVSVGALTLGRLRYDTDILKDCGELGNAFHVNVPLNGEVVSRCGTEQICATTNTAAVFNPRGRTVLENWRAGTTQLCLKIDRTLVEQEVARFLDHPLHDPLRFDFAMDLRSGHGQRWMQALRLLSDELDSPGGAIAHPLLAVEVQRLIIGTLIWAQPHSYSEELRKPAVKLRPRNVHQAMQAIDANPEMPWTAGQLAEVAGVGLRSLEEGFRRHVGVSPIQYLRSVRLDRAHQDLLSEEPETTTVTEIAFRWGFSHLSRFAEAYAQRYGEKPSDTLRRMS
jgi:AraC-like DNA-binding protein